MPKNHGLLQPTSTPARGLQWLPPELRRKSMPAGCPIEEEKKFPIYKMSIIRSTFIHGHPVEPGDTVEVHGPSAVTLLNCRRAIFNDQPTDWDQRTPEARARELAKEYASDFAGRWPKR